MDKKELIITELNNIFGFLQLAPAIDFVEDPTMLRVVVTGPELNHLIGFRGTSLDALETLLNMIVFRKSGESISIFLDVNDYRSSKIERLQMMAKRLIDKVRFFEKEVEMPPMEPWERKQVHILVTEYDDIESESTGRGHDRRVILKPKKK